jgi:hypothetical protein
LATFLVLQAGFIVISQQFYFYYRTPLGVRDIFKIKMAILVVGPTQTTIQWVPEFLMGKGVGVKAAGA